MPQVAQRGMAGRFPVDLAIIAGHPVMVGLGSLGGKAIETGLAIASRDAVAADAVGARLLGFQTQAVRHLHEVGQPGLGETDASRLQVVGLGVEEAFRLFTRQVSGRELNPPHP